MATKARAHVFMRKAYLIEGPESTSVDCGTMGGFGPTAAVDRRSPGVHVGPESASLNSICIRYENP
jgi:hypothetical protein